MPSKTYRLIGISEELRQQRRPCWICGQPIDYTLPHNDTEAFTVEHIHPRSTHPHLENDPANCVAAHASCNKRRGNRNYKPGLGVRSREW
ncbi:HNH endonuclease [Rhodococcus sp. MEB064]|uniref:HNH endonuclease n=1 Tax=Rhodococcus sp. MEB064 TaxID=1587522 RepID=UPI0009E619DE|nr:HNH endonuclease [Rhodococcus sp. MEB064]